LGKKEEDRIKEEARDFFERYLELEEILGIRAPFENPLERTSVHSVEDAETAADKLRNEWALGLDALPNVHELLEGRNIKVHEAPEAPEAFDGFSGKADGNRVVVLSGWLDDNIPRKRMTLVHELAHAVLPVDEHIDDKENEKLAKRFGGAFLSPRETIESLFGGNRTQVSLQELIEIKAVYGVSIMAIVTRAHQLSYLTESAHKSFCIHYNKQKWRTEGEPGDDQFSGRETSHRFKMLVYRALAEEQISMSKAAALLGKPLEQVRDEFSIVT
jgi:Zn-dependent peptidase ImmA (M78 family)